MYMPHVRNAHIVKTIHFERHLGTLLDNVESQGDIEYLYLLSVAAKESTTPVLIVSAETSESTRMAMQMLGGEVVPMLCAFAGNGHHNYGSLRNCPDVAAFEERAVAVVEERLHEKRTDPEIPLL